MVVPVRKFVTTFADGRIPAAKSFLNIFEFNLNTIIFNRNAMFIAKVEVKGAVRSPACAAWQMLLTPTTPK